MIGSESEGEPSLLLDTHVLVWLMGGVQRLGPKARAAIHAAGQRQELLISAITPWEVALLVSKKRIEVYRDVLEWVRDALATPGASLAALEPEIAVASVRLPFDMHADPADRILVATARHLGASLVTADEALLEIAKDGHFKTMDASL